MNILRINEHVSKQGGGAEIYCNMLNDLLEKEGHIINNFSIKSDYKKNKPILFIKSIFSLKYYNIIKNLINKYDPDIIHVHNFYNTLTPSIFISAKKMNIPIVLSLHGYTQWNKTNIFFKFPIGFLNWIKYIIRKNIVKKHVDIFECPSESIANFFSKEFDIKRKNIIVNPRPIDWNDKKIKKKNRRNKNILYVGRLTKNKGVDTLIKSIKNIRIDDFNIKLQIVGEGPEKNNLIKLSKNLNIEDKIFFNGYIKHSLLIDNYSNADLVVLPSIIPESNGLILIEAMSQSTPVITTNHGGQSELVKEGFNGFLFKPGDVKGLSYKICKILNDEKLSKKMGNNARKFVEENFKPIDHLERIFKIYCSLIRN